VLLGACTTLAWGFLFFLAGHVSPEPRVLGRWTPAYGLVIGALFALCLALSLSHAAPAYRRLHAARRNLAALSVSTALTLALAEASVRIMDPRGISYFEEFSRFDRGAKIPDEQTTYRVKPNLRGIYQGALVVTNDLGLRDRPVEPRRPGELRILALGDSVTFGWGVAAEDRYTDRLERSLAARLGRPARVINTGCDSYNTTEELRTLERFGDRFEPDLVTLLYVYNDVFIKQKPWDPERDYTLSGVSPPQVVERLAQRAWLFRMLRFTMLVRGGVNEASMADRPERASPGWRESMGSLAEIARYCHERAIPLAVFLWRTKQDALTDAQQQDIAAIAARSAFPFCDVLPMFQGHSLPDVQNSIVDSHPNARGHAILAAGMEECLARSGLLGGEPR
jgi:lysophospholipase L1-like esterase